ncbi:MAG: YbhB/YbcL family Raf kinase inhibitor-like protein [Phycisphaerae bacterium]
MTRSPAYVRLWWAGVASLVLIGCKPASEAPRNIPDQTGGTPMSLTIQSSAFANNAVIPARFTGDGEDVSPPLTWSGVPDGAKELALIMDDPDAPTPEPWVHWVIYKIPVDTSGLAASVAKTATLAAPAGALQGKNSFGNIGYGGPAPPRGHGVHHYHFKLYALDTAMNLSSSLSKTQLLSAMKGHILAEGELVGTYQR